MRDFLFQYHGVAPTTWVYLSSLLMIGLFFKFSRFWSLRNLDLVMLIGLGPGLLLVYNGNFMQVAARAELNAADTGQLPPRFVAANATVDDLEAPPESDASSHADQGVVMVGRLQRGHQIERWGYLWLFIIGLAWLVRLLFDSTMIRRPLIAPNLSVGGLAFIGVSLFVFLMANVVSRQPVIESNMTAGDQVIRMDALLPYEQQQGPGYAVLGAIPSVVRKALVVVSHLGIVVGIALVGHRHFGNATNGIGAATLYLMLPYTSQMTGRLDHSLPAALIVFATLFYRRPVASGTLLGAACGCIYYPMFLLPLWASFYWRRGLFRFLGSVIVVLVAMAVGLVSLPASQGFLPDLQRMFGLILPAKTGLLGMWDPDIGGWDMSFRIPVLTAFVVLSISLIFWPSPKNLGSLLSCSAAVMVACQFWHGYGGGLYMAWYLPILLLTIFRPNLEDRGVQTVLQSPRNPRPVVRATSGAEAA